MEVASCSSCLIVHGIVFSSKNHLKNKYLNFKIGQSLRGYLVSYFFQSEEFYFYQMCLLPILDLRKDRFGKSGPVLDKPLKIDSMA